MRIALAGINHETNTYCRDLTTADDFHVARGDRILRARGRETPMGGALEACDELGITPVPVMLAMAHPSGTIEAETYQRFKAEILAGLVDVAPDAVFLDLHGAGVVQGIADLEGDLVSSIREALGRNVPIVATFDLHGNITGAMCSVIDGVFACRHYPHIDLHIRAREAIQLAQRMVEAGVKTQVSLYSLPMLMPTTTTFEGPGKTMLAQLLELQAQTGVLDISWFHGFPFTDVPHVGSHLVVTAETGNQDAAQAARQAAGLVWHARESFRVPSLSAAEAVADARQGPDFPVVINETSDNPGGGTPGDGTHLLRAMLEAELTNACFGFIYDPEVANQAHEAGVGKVIQVSLGGKTDDLHGEPLALSAYVKALSDGRTVMQAMFRGTPINLGRTARLVVNGIDIVVTSFRTQTFDVEPFLTVGIDVNRYEVVALKSSNHFRAGFSKIAARIVTADPPGLTTQQVGVFSRENSVGPLWPVADPQVTDL
ncbi:MAG: M81 family metallopeptidase [Pseudomonadales bacterium]|nr:M81 family metallopeptidase [Pseudomonadales bacterium]